MAFNPNCYIIGLVGGKGGVGKSVLAANLSVATLIELKSPTLLVDADYDSCGDQNMILGLRTPKTIEELTKITTGINPQNFASFLTPHPSGLQFLGMIKNPGEKTTFNPDTFVQKLEALSHHFRFIFLDLGNQLHPLQMSLIEKCTLLLMVTTPDVMAVAQTVKAVNHLMTSLVPGEMIRVVLNRYHQGANSPQIIQQNVKREVIGVVPLDDLTLASALQRSTPFVLGNNKAPISQSMHEIVRRMTGGILQQLATINKSQKLKFEGPAEAPSNGTEVKKASVRGKKTDIDPRNALKMGVHTQLIKAMNLKNEDITKVKDDPVKEEVLKNDVRLQISKIVDKDSPGLPAPERKQIIQEILDEALGLGPLEDLLADSGVSEIMVNGFERIFYEKEGRIQLSKIKFTSNLQLRNVIERIVTPLGRRIDEKTPYVDARLADGSRVNAVIEPLSIDGPALTIRKFRQDTFGADQYIGYNSASRNMMTFLKICVENGLNVVISGGTGSGKTTLLNCLSTFIPSTERIITVEDAAELQLRQEHVVRLETRPANMEGSGAITIRDLVRNSLRMRPDRIVVGECRDGAALDMLSAMNTGHDGSMTTVHSNSARECISRLETLCMMAGMDLPARAIREQIAGAVDLIVQISRLSDGSRKLLSITEVQGMQGETITLQEVFSFKEKGFDKNRKIIGEFQATGLIPKFIEKFEQRGIVIPKEIFSNEKPKQEVAASNPGVKTPGPTPMPQRPQAPSIPTKKTGTGGNT